MWIPPSSLTIVLGLRGIQKLNHKSETVRIRLRGLEVFMRWLVIPIHAGHDIGPQLFYKILKQLGMSLEEFQKLR